VWEEKGLFLSLSKNFGSPLQQGKSLKFFNKNTKGGEQQ